MLLGFDAVYTLEARLLILGSFPGVASLDQARYYAHPRNQFWTILGSLIGADLQNISYGERLQIVKSAGIAIWDVLQSCQRAGSLDSAIRQARVNPLIELVARLPRLRAIAFNGQAAARQRGLLAGCGLQIFELPSTSPAYASKNLEDKRNEWSVIREALV